MVVYLVDKLPCHLRGHEGMGHSVLFKIAVQRKEVEPYLLCYDIYRSTHRKWCPYIHQRCIKAIAGIGCHPAVLVYVHGATVHVAESRHVTVRQLTSLGLTCGARGVEHDEER